MTLLSVNTSQHILTTKPLFGHCK